MNTADKITLFDNNTTGNLPLRTILCDNCQHQFVSFIRRPASDLDVIRSDHVPTPNEAAQVHELLTEDLQEVGRYKAEIARLRQLADKLETEMLAIEEQITSHRTLLSASRRFPVEIWDKIFDQACALGSFRGFHLVLRYSNGEASAKPLKLSAVCYKWRKILFDRPHLWSSISVDIHRVRRDTTGLIRLYLKNSVGHPLTIRIEDRYKWDIRPEHLDDPDFPRRHFGFGLDVFKILMEEMPRCEDLHLGVHWASIETFLEDPPASLPYTMLQSLTNETDVGVSSALGPSWFWSSIRNAPRLRNVQAPDEHHLTFLPHSQITSLKLEKVHGVRSIQTILLVCTRIESLKIRRFIPAPMGPGNSPGIPLPSLRTLSISVSGRTMPSSVDDFLRAFSMPSLVSLTVDCCLVRDVPLDAEWPPESFRALLTQNSESLEALTLRLPCNKMPYDYDTIHEILRVTSNLKDLELCMLGERAPDLVTPTSIQLFSQMTPADSPTRRSSVLLPKLERVHFAERYAPMSSCSAEVLLEMMESRSQARLLEDGRQNVSPIQSLALDFRGRASMIHDMVLGSIDSRLLQLVEGAEERLERLQGEGVNIIVLLDERNV